MSPAVRLPYRKLGRLLLSAVLLVVLIHVLITSEPDRRAFHVNSFIKDSLQFRQTVRSFPKGNEIESNSTNRIANMGLSSRRTELEEAFSYYNLTEFWERAGNMLGQNELYPEDFNVSIVLNKMATTKIISAQGSPDGTSFKWKVRLDGGQYVVFKPQLVLFGFRTLPFVAGRRVNITSEILPHATLTVQKSIKTYPNGTACILHKCFYCKVESTTCFPDGLVDGSLMFWLHQPLHYRLGVNSSYHPFHQLTFNKSIYNFGVNDHHHCDWVRSMRLYDQPRYFLDMVDMTIMGHVLANQDEKHVYISDADKKPIMTVHIDHGLGMCASKAEVNAKNLAAVTQCCRVRESTIAALRRRLPTLREDFERLSSVDRLYPLLSDHQLDALLRRVDEVFEAVRKCEEIVDSSVLFDKIN